MKYLLLFIILVLFIPTIHSFAQEKVETQNSQQQTVVSKPATEPEKRTVADEPFVPSEEISADSVIPLPSDI